jgi:hypothetical protein
MSMEAGVWWAEFCPISNTPMKHALLFLLALATLAACNMHRGTVIPLTTELQDTASCTILWSGTSEAYRYTNGTYVRDMAYDYTFTVEQRRYGNEWRSVKDLHRLHPQYDGRAGDRDQTMYFRIAFRTEGGQVRSTLHTSLGEGEGTTDAEYREQRITIPLKEVGRFSPYDHIRITQHYGYEEGVLRETVELYKLRDGREEPFMKNEETARFFMPVKLDAAPTRFE